MDWWLIFALMTVASWGVYGVFLHAGQVGMADPVHGRYKAFLWVGIAYFLVAVLAPLAVLFFDPAPEHVCVVVPVCTRFAAALPLLNVPPKVPPPWFTPIVNAE